MKPSLPIELPVKTKLIEVTDPLECAMLRFGLSCGNDAYYAFICPEATYRHRIIPVCQMCMDDSGEFQGKTWVMQIEALMQSGHLQPE